MLYKFVAAAAIATAIVGGPSVSQAQNDPIILWREISQWFRFCNMHFSSGCIHFGVLLGQHTDKWPEWRQTNPEWFSWEKGQVSPPDLNNQR